MCARSKSSTTDLKCLSMAISIMAMSSAARNGFHEENDMERLEVIQQVIRKRNLKTYLEIGVLGGHVFFKVNCRRKIAVDPHFKFNWRGRLGETIRNPDNMTARDFETTSDAFFERHAS